MTSYTPRLDLPFIEAAQAQKHVTHNAALERLDVMVQLRVQQFGATTPPASPVSGQSWALGAAPTGVWAGHDNQIATFAGGGWLFITPGPGWRAWGLTESALRVWGGAAWNPVGLGPGDLNNLPVVGINATADQTNRLTVSAGASLFNHAGGDHRIKVNKANTGATASLLYQKDFSGRAEMGLAGNDDFSVKVSADGNTWQEALRVDATSGAVSLPATPTRQYMAYNYRHYLYTDNRWVAPTASASSTNAVQSLGTDPVPSTDWDSKGVFVPAGSRLHSFVLAGAINGAEVTGLDIGLYYQYGPWNAGWTSPAQTVRSTLYTQSAIGISSTSGMNRYRIALNITTAADGYFFLATRPTATSVLTATRYFDCAGVLELSCPL